MKLSADSGVQPLQTLKLPSTEAETFQSDDVVCTGIFTSPSLGSEPHQGSISEAEGCGGAGNEVREGRTSAARISGGKYFAVFS